MVGNFLANHNIPDMKDKLTNYKKQLNQSTFTWVDSVLVKSIVAGDWVVFENANLCNPSILDRLNSLLEDSNQSLMINE